MTASDVPQILLVEDDDDHAEIIIRALANNQNVDNVRRVSDGEAALDCLLHRGNYVDPELNPLPAVVLLDLRLPRVDGLDVLRTIKNSPELRAIPVIILTTSSAAQDIEAAYESHANSYLVKPVEFGQLAQMMKTLGTYWLAWNRTPHDESAAAPHHQEGTPCS